MARRRLPYDTPAGNVITMRDVHKSYAKNTDALNGVTIDIKDGEFVFIVGDSGSGKSIQDSYLDLFRFHGNVSLGNYFK